MARFSRKPNLLRSMHCASALRMGATVLLWSVASCGSTRKASPVVPGPGPAPSACDPVGITVVTETPLIKWREIRSHGLPDHTTGTFPNSGNPFSIEEQCYYFKIPYRDDKGTDIPFPGSPYELELPARFGVATNGVVFDPLTNDFFNPDVPELRAPPDLAGSDLNWRYNACHSLITSELGIDDHNAHPQDDGAYHYHGDPDIGGYGSPELIGWAFDGYPIYGSACGRPGSGPGDPGVATRMHSSYQLVAIRAGKDSPPLSMKDRDGNLISLPLGVFDQDYTYVEGGGLDACNGHTSPTLDFPEGSYHYHVTEEFPCIPRCHFLMPTEE